MTFPLYTYAAFDRNKAKVVGSPLNPLAAQPNLTAKQKPNIFLFVQDIFMYHDL